jgi:hypothetical protein
VLGLLLGMVDGVLTVLPVGVAPLPSMALGLAFEGVPGLVVDGTASAVAGSRWDDVPEHATDPQTQRSATNWSFMFFPLLQRLMRARRLASHGAANWADGRQQISRRALLRRSCAQQQPCLGPPLAKKIRRDLPNVTCSLD